MGNQGYDPSEPRVFAGQSGGGHWTTGNPGGTETEEQQARWKTEGDYPTGDARFDKFIKFVFTHENVLGKDGKVVPENVAGDNGGLTKYGIDQASHPGVDIAGLNKQKATGNIL